MKGFQGRGMENARNPSRGAVIKWRVEFSIVDVSKPWMDKPSPPLWRRLFLYSISNQIPTFDLDSFSYSQIGWYLIRFWSLAHILVDKPKRPLPSNPLLKIQSSPPLPQQVKANYYVNLCIVQTVRGVVYDISIQVWHSIHLHQSLINNLNRNIIKMKNEIGNKENFRPCKQQYCMIKSQKRNHLDNKSIICLVNAYKKQ